MNNFLAELTSFYGDRSDKRPNASHLLNVIYEYLQQTQARGMHLNINGFPKSGTSFLSAVLCELMKFNKYKLYNGYLRSEHKIRYSNFLDAYSENYVLHSHFLGDDENIYYFNKFQIRPVIIVRNIFDIIISLTDQASYSKKCDDLSIIWIAYLTDHFKTLPQEDRINIFIDYTISWYYKFYLTWYYATKIENKIEVLWLTYEQLVNNKLATLKTICDFYNIDKPENDLIKAIIRAEDYKVDTNFNKGIIGRGNEILSDQQKDKILSLSNYYPDVDFSMMGL